LIQTKRALPRGDFAIWIIVYVELITFGILFVGYAFARSGDVALFNESQLLLDQRFGFANTLLLITSSFFVVKAIQSLQLKEHKKASKLASRWLIGAMTLGGFFIIDKIIEFAGKVEEGINLSTNTFFMFYIILTVFHFMHVLLGLVILFNIQQKAKKGGYTADDISGAETGAIYWHLVDLLWIVLFPLIYIIR